MKYGEKEVKEMKKLLLLLIPFILVLTLLATPVLAKSPFVPPGTEPGGWVILAEGAIEYQGQTGNLICVSYNGIREHNKNKSVAVSLGIEVWIDWGEEYEKVYDSYDGGDYLHATGFIPPNPGEIILIP